ncbi:MAG: C1 family peptidase [Roseovarius sp.]|nr:C1 family peptidase [Roseovarius sp.]
MKLTITKDVRAELHCVRDQGRRPTCMAFAASDAHGHARCHSEYLCVEWLFYHVCKQAGTGPHVGITISDTLAALKSPGQPEESIWPYSGQPPDPTTWKPPIFNGTLFTCGSTVCIGGMRTVCQNIDQDVPVVIAMFISDTFIIPQTWECVGSEVILGPDMGRPVDNRRAHAMVVVGRGTFNGDPIMLLRNSWGANWGNNGHAWVRESYLEPRLASAFVIQKR